ncbi:MAG: glycosyltransferase family 4 protein, partial [Anaerolineae bacterium]|nr:glycosyltransferase family 4 protein [Anaerolineae bacterium]
FAFAGSVRKGQHGLPNVLVEAMSSGLGVITTELPPVRELIEDGVDGLVVSDNDEAIYQGLRTLLVNDALRRDLGQRARQKALEKFSIAASTQRLHQLFMSVLPTESASAPQTVLAKE